MKTSIKYTIDETLFKVSNFIANLDYLYYEEKNSQKQQQNKNTKIGCLTGVLGERAAFLYLNNKYKNVISYAMRERENRTYYNNKSDIHFINDYNIEEKIEVKTIRKGYPRGQVLIQHIEKYKKNKVKGIIFVEIDIKEDYCDCLIYEIITIEEIEKSEIKKNLLNRDCYTIN